MARGLRELRARIRSNKSIRQITKAMEMVSASRFRRAQERALHSKPYASKMQEVILRIASGSVEFSHPMLESRPVKKTGYLLITSDRGLAGGYNANLIRMLQKELNEKHQSKEEYILMTIGRKGRDYFQKRKYPVVSELIGLSDFPAYADIQKIAKEAVSSFKEETCDELYLVYNEFVNAMSQRPRIVRLLPLIEGLGESEREDGGRETIYEYEPSPKAVLSELLPRYAETLIYSAVLEAKAGENAARMTAMKSATDNATELIDHYTLQLNRARQAAITQEISEIVAGANAL